MSAIHVASGRASLAAQVTGAEHAPSVLMLHAGVADKRSWGPLVARLGSSVRCIRYDRRGYGDTVYEAEEGWSPVADAVAVMDATGSDSAIVVGNSIGGGTAIDLALAHPDRVRALVLIAPAITGAAEPELEPVVAALDEEIDAADERADLVTVNQLETHFWLDGPASAGRVTGAARDLFLDMNARALAAVDPGEPTDTPDAWSQLDRITVPVLFLVGSLDLRHFRTDAAAAAASVRHGQYLELLGTAHVPQLEGHAPALDAIAEFIAAYV